MRRVMFSICALVILLTSFATVNAQTEQDVIDQFFKKAESKHTTKLSWVSLSYTANRVNRNNTYNQFVDSNSPRFSNADLTWLNVASSFGLEMGLRVGDRIAWTLGGEYWAKQGTNEAGSFTYTPPSGTPVQVSNLTSEISVYGFSTGLNYFLKNAPKPGSPIQNISIRLNSTIGYYYASWDLWNEYENLNLSTSAPSNGNTTFKGSAPGFSFNVGADYPLNFLDLSLCGDVGYFYLNFNNVAWYNLSDDEVIATYDETANSRVDLNMSGIRGKIEFRRYFQW